MFLGAVMFKNSNIQRFNPKPVQSIRRIYFMQQGLPMGALFVNYVLACEAFPNLPNLLCSRIPGWNLHWVRCLSLMLNFGVSNGKLDPSFMVGSMQSIHSPVGEDTREELIRCLRGGMLSANLMSILQTSSDILNAPLNAAFDAGVGKLKAPFNAMSKGWVEKGEKVIDWGGKIKNFKSQMNNDVNRAIGEFTLLL
jgi:hypothetical protein